GSDMEFLKDWKKVHDADEAKHAAGTDHHATSGKHADSHSSAHPADAHPAKMQAEKPKEDHSTLKAGAESTTLQAGVQQTKFELGAGGEEMAWRDWQEKMNKAIFSKMDDLVH